MRNSAVSSPSRSKTLTTPRPVDASRCHQIATSDVRKSRPAFLCLLVSRASVLCRFAFTLLFCAVAGPFPGTVTTIPNVSFREYLRPPAR